MRILDTFCKAGGCSRGYELAGFDVFGVDIEPQPNYPYDFEQADALEYLTRDLSGFDAIHASPPCQHYANVTRWTGNQDDHPDLIGPTRDLLDATGLPYVIENVVTPQIRADYMLCGTALGLPIRRHRHFETNWSGFVMSSPCLHSPRDLAFDHSQERAYADAMECWWMSSIEARQAVPPAYTRYIGEALLAHVHAKAATC